MLTLSTDDARPLGYGIVSWDGYHHHLALKTLNGPIATCHEPEVGGIEAF